MALADYRLCDLCDNKAFYDCSLHYNGMESNVNVRDRNYSLERLGDWKVLCQTCAQTNKCIIVPIKLGVED